MGRIIPYMNWKMRNVPKHQPDTVVAFSINMGSSIYHHLSTLIKHILPTKWGDSPFSSFRIGLSENRVPKNLMVNHCESQFSLLEWQFGGIPHFQRHPSPPVSYSFHGPHALLSTSTRRRKISSVSKPDLKKWNDGLHQGGTSATLGGTNWRWFVWCNVAKTMSLATPMTGNGKFIPAIEMVMTAGWLQGIVQMALFYPHYMTQLLKIKWPNWIRPTSEVSARVSPKEVPGSGGRFCSHKTGDLFYYNHIKTY
jgi:hypothetical protein